VRLRAIQEAPMAALVLVLILLLLLAYLV